MAAGRRRPASGHGVDRASPAARVRGRMSGPGLIRSLFRPGDAGRSGAVAIQVGIMLVAIVGFVSLGSEIVLLLATSRHMQSAADAGVLAAVSARMRGYPAD